MRQIRIGYVPLTDVAVLVAAARRGFAERHGLSLVLERENSWATLRDKLALGHFDGAHLLAPLAVAMTIGLGPGPASALTVPFVLSRDGNSIAVSMRLWREMEASGTDLAEMRAGLGRAGRARAGRGEPLRLASVFPYSTHTFLLRRLLEGTGLDPERDVALTVVPPPYSAAALAEEAVDAICVGAPWPSVAVEAGAGRLVALGPWILPGAPEKVLALPRGGLAADVVRALVAALAEAAAWCGAAQNRPELAGLLGEASCLDQDPAVILRALEGRLPVEKDGPEASEPDYLVFGGDRHRPDPEIADWILREMEAAGQARPDERMRSAARAIFEPFSFDCI